MKTFNFYKENHNWYIDLPTYPGSKEELQMVDGADTWLDRLSNNSTKVCVVVSKEHPLENKLELIVDNQELGATYKAEKYKEEVFNHTVWLCPVTLWVFGEYPPNIWYFVHKENDKL